MRAVLSLSFCFTCRLAIVSSASTYRISVARRVECQTWNSVPKLELDAKSGILWKARHNRYGGTSLALLILVTASDSRYTSIHHVTSSTEAYQVMGHPYQVIRKNLQASNIASSSSAPRADSLAYIRYFLTEIYAAEACSGVSKLPM